MVRDELGFFLNHKEFVIKYPDDMKTMNKINKASACAFLESFSRSTLALPGPASRPGSLRYLGEA